MPGRFDGGRFAGSRFSGGRFGGASGLAQVTLPFAIAFSDPLDPFNAVTGEFDVDTPYPNQGTYEWERQPDGGGTALETGSAAVVADEVLFDENGTTGTPYTMVFRQLVNGVLSTNSLSFDYVADNTAPVQTVAIAVGDTQLVMTPTVNEAGGQSHFVITTTSTPLTAAQIKAHASVVLYEIASTGEQPSHAFTGLTNDVAYYIHHVATDARGNESTAATVTETPAAASGNMVINSPNADVSPWVHLAAGSRVIGDVFYSDADGHRGVRQTMTTTAAQYYQVSMEAKYIDWEWAHLNLQGGAYHFIGLTNTSLSPGGLGEKGSATGLSDLMIAAVADGYHQWGFNYLATGSAHDLIIGMKYSSNGTAEAANSSMNLRNIQHVPVADINAALVPYSAGPTS